MTAYSETSLLRRSKILIPFTYKSTKHKDDTDDDERFNCSEPICFRDVAGDAVENIDKDKKDCDEDGHPARNTFRRNKEADPGDNDEHPGRKVVGDYVM